MAAVLRPQTALGCYMEGDGQPGRTYVDTDTKVGQYHTILGDGIRGHLERYCEHAPPGDQQRCIQLLTSLAVGEALKDRNRFLGSPPPASAKPCRERIRRPHTAMAYTEMKAERKESRSAYETAYSRDFPAPPSRDISAVADRPDTSNHFKAAYVRPSHAHARCSLYDKVYEKKHVTRYDVRVETPRRNKPHPPQTFMNWTYKKIPDVALGSPPGDQPLQLTNDVFDRLVRGKTMSTYQLDFRGLAQGEREVNEPVGVTCDWRDRAPHTLDTSSRRTYTHPSVHPQLTNNTTRYGCNRHKQRPAVGAAPNISSFQLNLKTTTAYDGDFVNPSVYKIRDMGDKLTADAVQRFYSNSADKNGRNDRLCQSFKNMNGNYRSTSSQHSSSVDIRTTMKFRPTPPPMATAMTPTRLDV